MCWAAAIFAHDFFALVAGRGLPAVLGCAVHLSSFGDAEPIHTDIDFRPSRCGFPRRYTRYFQIYSPRFQGNGREAGTLRMRSAARGLIAWPLFGAVLY